MKEEPKDTELVSPYSGPYGVKFSQAVGFDMSNLVPKQLENMQASVKEILTAAYKDIKTVHDATLRSKFIMLCLIMSVAQIVCIVGMWSLLSWAQIAVMLFGSMFLFFLSFSTYAIASHLATLKFMFVSSFVESYFNKVAMLRYAALQGVDAAAKSRGFKTKTPEKQKEIEGKFAISALKSYTDNVAMQTQEFLDIQDSVLKEVSVVKHKERKAR